MYYLCMHMNMHVFARTSCHAFIPNQISFPISLFSNSFSDSEKPGSHSPQHIYPFFQYKDSPKRSHSSLCCHPLYSASSDTADTSAPLYVTSPPYTATSATHAAALTKYHPFPTHLLRCCCLSPGWKGTGRWEGKKITGSFHWWMDLRISQMFATTRMHLCLMNTSLFSLHLLSFTLSALPASLQGCVSV